NRGRNCCRSPTTAQSLARQIVQAHLLNAAAIRRLAARKDLHFAIAESEQGHSIDNADGDRCSALLADHLLAGAGSFEIQREREALRQHARLKCDEGLALVNCVYDAR